MHLESRSTMTFSSFFRSLVIYMATTIIASLVYLFCSFFGPPFRPWSWKTVHASMSEIDIVTSQSDEMESIRLAWWGGFVITVLYLLLSISLGDEVRDIFKWVKKQAAREQHFVLPIQCVFFPHKLRFDSSNPLFFSALRKMRLFHFSKKWLLNHLHQEADL